MTSLPTWDQFMSPVLTVLLDGNLRSAKELRTAVADLLKLDEAARAELIPSGQPRYENRTTWAMSYLARAGAVERPARGTYQITPVGKQLLADHPGGITEAHLRALAGDPNAPHTWKAFTRTSEVSQQDVGVLDPVEQIEESIAHIRAGVEAELLTRLQANEPAFFAQAVLDLLIAMGYGGAEGKATRAQLSNDVGIDGIVDQDALGLSRIYVQAKRYSLDATVGRPEIQAFVGALHGQQANEGVFITTARFSRDAIGYANTVASRVVLIEGSRLASLMIRYGVGVQTKRVFSIVEIDEDFFE